jgi:cell division septation protein DedD
VQVGSFRYRDEAELLHQRLRQKGYLVHIYPAAVPGKGLVYRVHVGSFLDRATADQTAQRLATQERVTGIVVDASR